MSSLKESEVKKLYSIKDAIDKGIAFDEILNVCEHIKPQLKEPGFAYTYAACLLASHDRINDASQMFRSNKEDTFCSIMYEYLKDVGSFITVGEVFKSVAPYDIYVQTSLYNSHMSGTVEGIFNFAKQNPPQQDDEVITILDIGPGNGILTAQFVNKIVKYFNLKKIRLIFIDPFEDMLKTASENCKNSIDAECETIGICCKIQEITKDQIDLIQQTTPIWFINAALSVHHMPKEEKIPMLKQLKEFSPNFILSEVNWNHDLPEKDSPELIYSVANNYAFFSRDILNLPLSLEKKKLCLYHFPIAEAINIIKQDRANRIDYHTPIEQWKKIGSEAGYLVADPTPTNVVNGEPFFFVMVFKEA